MTRPKKWFMTENDGHGGGIVLRNCDGLLKKPNALQPLGRISSVTVADAESSKYAQSVLVSLFYWRLKCSPHSSMVTFLSTILATPSLVPSRPTHGEEGASGNY